MILNPETNQYKLQNDNPYEDPDYNYIETSSPEKNLWATVLQGGLMGALLKKNREDLVWCTSESTEVTSFLWICRDVLNIENAEEIQKSIFFNNDQSKTKINLTNFLHKFRRRVQFREE